MQRYSRRPSRRRIPSRLSKRLPSSTCSAGAVLATVPRTLSCGTEMPIERQNIDDQAPAAHSTTEVLIVPCSVTTAETRPAADSIPRTAHAVRIVAPSRAAARAIAGAALCGSARASLGVYIAPAQRAVAPGTISLMPSASMMRVSRSKSFAVSSQAWKLCMSLSESAMNRHPPRTKPTLSPISLSSSLKIRMLSIIIGSSRGSRPCRRTQPQFRPDCSPAMCPFSHSATLTPCLARNHAVDTPTMPPPTMTTSAVGGTLSGARWTPDQVAETMSS